jgi:hypothetical protein
VSGGTWRPACRRLAAEFDPPPPGRSPTSLRPPRRRRVTLLPHASSPDRRSSANRRYRYLDATWEQRQAQARGRGRELTPCMHDDTVRMKPCTSAPLPAPVMTPAPAATFVSLWPSPCCSEVGAVCEKTSGSRCACAAPTPPLRLLAAALTAPAPSGSSSSGGSPALIPPSPNPKGSADMKVGEQAGIGEVGQSCQHSCTPWHRHLLRLPLRRDLRKSKES